MYYIDTDHFTELYQRSGFIWGSLFAEWHIFDWKVV